MKCFYANRIEEPQVKCSMLQALAELDLRAKHVPADLIAKAKELQAKRNEALAAYSEVAHEITAKLGYK